jgi:hypothetical protein
MRAATAIRGRNETGVSTVDWLRAVKLAQTAKLFTRLGLCNCALHT